MHHVWAFPGGRGPGTFSRGMGYKPLEVTGDPPEVVAGRRGRGECSKGGSLHSVARCPAHPTSKTTTWA